MPRCTSQTRPSSRIDQDELAVAAHADDAPAREAARRSPAPAGRAAADSRTVTPLDAARAQRRRQAAHDRLDLGQLRHPSPRRAPRARRAKSVERRASRRAPADRHRRARTPPRAPARPDPATGRERAQRVAQHLAALAERRPHHRLVGWRRRRAPRAAWRAISSDDHRGVDPRPRQEAAPRHAERHAHLAHVCTSTDSTPRASPPGRATSRSATSRCSITTARRTRSRSASRRKITGVETLYGRFATTVTSPSRQQLREREREHVAHEHPHVRLRGVSLPPGARPARDRSRPGRAARRGRPARR